METRPEAIKMAPVVQALRGHDRFETIVVATAQHVRCWIRVFSIFVREAIVVEAGRLLEDEHAYRAMISRRNPFGDGRAAERIVKTLDRWAA